MNGLHQWCVNILSDNNASSEPASTNVLPSNNIRPRKVKVVGNPHSISTVETLPKRCKDALDWINEKQQAGVLDGFWTFGNSDAGFLIFNVDDPEIALGHLENYPFSEFLNFSHELLISTDEALDETRSMIETHIRQIAGQLESKFPYLGGDPLQDVTDVCKQLNEASNWLKKQKDEDAFTGCWDSSGDLGRFSIIGANSLSTVQSIFEQSPFKDHYKVERMYPGSIRLNGMIAAAESVMADKKLSNTSGTSEEERANAVLARLSQLDIYS